MIISLWAAKAAAEAPAARRQPGKDYRVCARQNYAIVSQSAGTKADKIDHVRAWRFDTWIRNNGGGRSSRSQRKEKENNQ